jgi:hypothetical protein
MQIPYELYGNVSLHPLPIQKEWRSKDRISINKAWNPSWESAAKHLHSSYSGDLVGTKKVRQVETH